MSPYQLCFVFCLALEFSRHFYWSWKMLVNYGWLLITTWLKHSKLESGQTFKHCTSFFGIIRYYLFTTSRHPSNNKPNTRQACKENQNFGILQFHIFSLINDDWHSRHLIIRRTKYICIYFFFWHYYRIFYLLISFIVLLRIEGQMLKSNLGYHG